MYIPAYCSINFLEEIFNRNPIDFVKNENPLAGKNHFELLDLIVNGLNIQIDCTEEQLWASNNAYIKNIIKKNNKRINCVPKTFEEMRGNDTAFFQKIKTPTCLFLLTNCDGMLKEYRQKTGNYFLSLDSSFNEIFEDRLQTFNVKEEISWDFDKSFFNTHNAIAIADPYLFSNLATLEQFISNILPKKLSGNYHISLVGSDINKGNGLPNLEKIRNWVREQSAKLKRQCSMEIEYHIYKGEDFHDRVIITNNTMLYSGMGLAMIKQDVSTKETAWIGFKPYKRLNTNKGSSDFAYKLMLEKLSIIKKWISKSEQKDSANPLFAAV